MPTKKKPVVKKRAVPKKKTSPKIHDLDFDGDDSDDMYNRACNALYETIERELEEDKKTAKRVDTTNTHTKDTFVEIPMMIGTTSWDEDNIGGMSEKNMNFMVKLAMGAMAAGLAFAAALIGLILWLT